MKICPLCNTENDKNNLYCVKCGEIIFTTQNKNKNKNKMKEGINLNENLQKL